MIYMLDTNICIYIIKRKPKNLLDRFLMTDPEDIVISSITASELFYGVFKSSKPAQNIEALTNFLLPFEIVPFDDKASIEYGEIRANLEKEGNIIGSMDLLIAAHVRSLSLTLITNNIREFKRVLKLKMENWLEDF